MNKELNFIVNNEAFIGIYIKGVELLRDCGLLKFLEVKGRVNTSTKDSSSLSYEAARSAGYYECLDDVFNFKEKYLLTQVTQNNLPFDFGSSSQVIEDGDLTKEELNAIRGNFTPKYEPIPVTANGLQPNTPSK